ncbi:FkbM family methyltransferase [Chlorogloea sp. CCALA 695]|uniref:FkbM family methyltransferase n=1 Tax=Chlorogloea sp. CCALA 695 TaxID=2107693 RepID=UPI000D07E1FD|nr:FkbM family methyltransferase [Chlorogloea sp. CCALA 695]PSB32746.1 FkbM family methyltransferase [Chlorogloea sp. CCALA 695]
MFKDNLRKVIKFLGFEFRRYAPSASETARLQHFLNYHNIDLVLDVGANIGQYAKYLRNLGYCKKIVSFEPLSTAYSQLQTMSSKDPLWDIAPRSAIGNKEDKIRINISANGVSSSILDMLEYHATAAPESTYCDAEIVNLSRLDNIAKKYIAKNINSIFLKIDVQGFEKQVIEGATQILPIINGIQMELSLVPLYNNQVLFKEMIEFMEALDYEIHAFIPGFTDPKTGRLLQLDGIFFKK